MMKIGIIGCAGRMGKTVISEVLKSENVSLSAALEKPDSEHTGKDVATLVGAQETGIKISDNLAEVVKASDAIIDFTTPALTVDTAKLCAENGVIHIIATTGLSDEQKNIISESAAKTPIVMAPNMSVGVNLLFSLTEQVAKILDENFDIEILEMHHSHKVDAPSGTSLGIGEAAAKGRGVALKDVERRTRDGNIGARPKGEIGFATLRGGDIVGDHSAIFAGAGERIELTHKASDRSIYAKGALRAALWAKGKPPALYSMQDVLGI